MKIRGAEVLSAGGAIMTGYGVAVNIAYFDLMLVDQTPDGASILATESATALGGICMALGFRMLARRHSGHDPDDPAREDIKTVAEVIEMAALSASDHLDQVA